MKVLKIAAIVIGVVALVATGAGIALGGLAVTASATATTLMTIGAIAGVAGGVLSLGMSLLASRPSFGGQGNPLSFQTNPQSGLPYVTGRSRMSGLKIDGKTTSSKTDGTHNLIFLSALLSCTPVQAATDFTADGLASAFDAGSGAAIGPEAGWMAQKVSLGPMPQTSPIALTFDGKSYPGHSSTTKLSGMTYAEWALKYDPDGNHFSAGLPEPAWIVFGRKCYDPRKDSTYPGGSGAHRAGNEATYEWSRNGAIQALNWAMGHYANGKRKCGIGAPMENIRVADFVEAANIADANGWGCGGVEWTTDSKWDIFKRMLQAAGAVPSMGGAMLGCRVKTPRVSIGTITQDDFLDDLTYIATKPRRDRFNTVLPRYVSESHDWEVITGSEISVPAYVATDGGKRTKGIDFPLVQAELGQGYDGNKQAGQLAAYEIVDSREASIECTVKPRWIGLRVGDCVTLDKPDDGIVMQKVMITGVTLDPARGVLRLTVETETDSKHAFALGQTTTPPPAPTLNVPAGKPAVPDPAAWTVSAIAMADGQPGIRVTGAIDDPIADRVLVQYRRNGLLDWIGAPDIVGTGTRNLDLGPLDGLSGWDTRLAYGAGPQVGDWLEILNTGTDANDLILRPRGSYDAGTAYYPGDVVVWDNGVGYTGSSYKRVGTGATTGVVPSDGSKWVLLALRGASGGAPTLIADNVGGGGIVINADKIRKTGTPGWNASAYSQEGYKAFHARAVLVAGGGSAARLGVTNSPPEVESSHFMDADDIGFCRIVDNHVEVVTLPPGTWPDGSVLDMFGDGQQIYYWVNGELLYTSTTNVSGQWHMSVSAYSATAYSLSGLLWIPGGLSGADAVAFVQDANPGAPPNSSQLWIKPSTKQIFRWDGANWVDTHGDLARYNQIIASFFVPDAGVDLSALVPGQFNGFQSASAAGPWGCNAGGPISGPALPTLTFQSSGADLFLVQASVDYTASVSSTSTGVLSATYPGISGPQPSASRTGTGPITLASSEIATPAAGTVVFSPVIQSQGFAGNMANLTLKVRKIFGKN